ncbi:hypothetical protein ACH6EH_12875 [Paenibacillus sp. JSM ZJ436]|uniref:hypothetical protein n=1 Tax=Paenibacillus sp. JSM ZJ436 TaxID=3376190 RepID=UPI0037889DD5
MLNVVLLLLGMLSPISGEVGLTPMTASTMTSPVVHAELKLNTMPEQAPAEPEAVTLNGISLTDRIGDVVDKLGEPLEVTKEPLLGSTEYHYPDMTIGFYEDLTDYVRVHPSASTVQVNGQDIAMTTDALLSSLGEPYFRGEDGVSYVWEYEALKIFMDMDTGELHAVDLFVDYRQ